MSTNCGWNWRIALTEAGLEKGPLSAYGIPVPDMAAYNDATKESFRGQGEQAEHGFQNFDFLWDEIRRSKAFRLRKFMDDAKDGAGWLYMTVDLNDDSAPGPQWADIRGKPHRDIKQADAGPIAGRRGVGSHYSNYRMFMNNIQILNNPSNYTDT
jgi:hypothetical protein